MNKLRYACQWFEDYEKVLKDVANVFSKAFKKTEDQIGRPLTELEKKLGIIIGFYKFLDNSKNEKDH